MISFCNLGLELVLSSVSTAQSSQGFLDALIIGKPKPKLKVKKSTYS
jgi:hypothetical protein